MWETKESLVNQVSRTEACREGTEAGRLPILREYYQIPTEAVGTGQGLRVGHSGGMYALNFTFCTTARTHIRPAVGYVAHWLPSPFSPRRLSSSCAFPVDVPCSADGDGQTILFDILVCAYKE